MRAPAAVEGAGLALRWERAVSLKFGSQPARTERHREGRLHVRDLEVVEHDRLRSREQTRASETAEFVACAQ